MVFQPGDFVKINSTVASNPHKSHLIGKLFKIKGESAREHEKGIAYLVEGDPHWFYATEFEMVAFPKEALENGMIVEYRNGSLRMVHNNCFIGDIKFNYLDSYDDELKSLESENEDIIKIYKSTACSFSEIWKDHTLELVWSRNRIEPEKVTLDDLEELLGYRVTIVD